MFTTSSCYNINSSNQRCRCIMKDNVTYNHADNKVMVRTDGDLIYVICHKQEQHY